MILKLKKQNKTFSNKTKIKKTHMYMATTEKKNF